MGMEILQKYIDDLPKYDVFERMKNFGGKVIIAHGTADSVVDISYSRRLTQTPHSPNTPARGTDFAHLQERNGKPSACALCWKTNKKTEV